MSSVIEIILKGTDESATSTVNGLSSGLEGLAGLAGGALTVGLAAGAAGVAALAGGLAYSVSQAIDAQKVQAQLQAVLKSTGGQAGVTADAANALATWLSHASTFSDETVLAGENMLLTFTNIGKDVFPQATQSLVDLSTAMGTDPKNAAIQLGKALNDPIAGISALSRVGVSFTDDQKKVIESLVKTGDVAGAQKIILAELNNEFGGSAQAQAGTFAGQMEIVKNRLNEVAEGIGTALLPILTTLFNQVVTPALPIIERLGTVFAKVFTDLATGGDVIGNLKTGLNAVLLVMNVSPDVRAGIMGAISGFVSFVQTNLPLVQQTFGIVFSSINTIISSLVGFVRTTLLPAINEITGTASVQLPTAQQIFTAVMTIIQIAIQGVALIVTNILIPALTAAVNWVVANWPTIHATINTVMTNVNTVITTILNGIKTFWDTWGGTILSIVHNMTDAIQNTFQLFSDAFKGNWTQVGEDLRKIWNDNWNNFITILQTFITQIENIDWGSVGTGIVQGIASGITAGVHWIVEAATAAAQAALDAAKGFLGIHSPSTVFGEVGKNIMAGMSIGIAQGTQGTINTMQNSTSQMVNNYSYNLAIHSNANVENVANDFLTMKTLYGGA